MNSLALPLGMRDYGPDAAERLIAVEQRLLGLLRRYGYKTIRTPLVERYATLGSALPDGARDQAFHLVDPQTGEPLILRPDLTAQIARYVAGLPGGGQVPTDEANPVRLSYSGTVFRVERHYARAPRERWQTGAELIGWNGVQADGEVLDLALRCLITVGLICPPGHTASDPIRQQDNPGAVLVLGDAAVLDALLDALDLPGPKERAEVLLALQRKAYDDVAKATRMAGGKTAIAERLPGLQGRIGDLEAWRAMSWPKPVALALGSLAALLDRLSRHPASSAILLDLTEVRDRAYYTGIVFEAFARGSGRPVLTGGRYDKFLGRLGPDRAAAGFAVDHDALGACAGLAANLQPATIIEVFAAGAAAKRHIEPVLDGLRSSGYDAALQPRKEPEHSAAWVVVSAGGLRWSLSGSSGQGNVDDLLSALKSKSDS